jgi:two-component system invasion response regulator UvrY
VERSQVAVLVVDDLRSFRLAAAQVIEAAEGFVLVGEAASGEAALDFLQWHDVALVLMDVQMPGMGGVTAAREIARCFPRVAVVLLSVNSEADLPPGALSAGAQFCAKEQFGPAELEGLWREASRSPPT